jgi:hypothetical protein
MILPDQETSGLHDVGMPVVPSSLSVADAEIHDGFPLKAKQAPRDAAVESLLWSSDC